MHEKRVFALVQKGLFLKSAILSLAVIGIVLAKPVTAIVVSGAQQISQVTMKAVARCGCANVG